MNNDQKTVEPLKITTFKSPNKIYEAGHLMEILHENVAGIHSRWQAMNSHQCEGLHHLTWSPGIGFLILRKIP